MAKEFVINVMARDRVGIVAGVTRAVDRLKGAVDAVSQTVLQGYFTLILTARFPDDTAAESVRGEIEKSGTPGELAVSVKPRERAAEVTPAGEGDQFVISVLGRHRPGIVNQISAYLSSRSINIVDLYAYTVGGDVVMISQVMVPKRLDVRQIQIDLEGLAGNEDLQIRLQHEDIFVATNEIDFRHRNAGPRTASC